ncbi:MAG TPA: plastocyanin/azurin family copper-binding protein [Longimicrobiales bacterium]|nr:plastocyanin/azurin family copper-binding protein [Longimicrobiales bacterium]
MKFGGRMVAVLGLTLAAAACGSGDAAPAGERGDRAPSVEPTGTVHEVTMASIGGERFGPDELTVQRGDVVRFVLESGVHNVSFPADVNVAGVALPEASPFLQVPGQHHDILIDMPAGEYTFHCDPHVFLGMVGKLTVLD